MSRKTKSVLVGNVQIGAGAPVSVQSMTNTKTADIKETLAQIEGLEKDRDYTVDIAYPGYQSRQIKTRTMTDVYLGDIALTAC